jgi:hypothetical protein
MFKKILLYVFFLPSITMFAFSENPYDILGLSYSSTEKDITKRCRDLKAYTHPESRLGGANADEFIRIDNACDSILHRSSNVTHRDDIIDGQQNDKPSSNQQFNDDFFKRQQDHFNASSTDYENHDRCTYEGESCTCSNSGWKGFCKRGTIKSGLYCQCPNPSYAQGTKGGTFSGTHQSKPPRIGLNIFSRTIEAPIYNIPLMRTMMPLFVSSDGVIRWESAIAPFVKTPITAFDGQLRQKEGGFLWGGRIAWRQLWFDGVTAFSSVHTDITSHSKKSSESFTKFGITDALITLGTAKQFQKFGLAVKGIFGVSSHLGHDHKTLDVNHNLVRVPHTSAGVELESSWLVSEGVTHRYVIFGLLRDLYFFKNHIGITNSQPDSVHAGIKEKKRSSDLATVDVKPGNFIDLVIGFNQQFGLHFEHRTECGYDATFHSSAKAIVRMHDTLNVIISPHMQKEPLVRHTLYATYNHDFALGNVPISWGIGLSWTIKQQSYNDSHKQSALFWTSFTFPC